MRRRLKFSPWLLSLIIILFCLKPELEASLFTRNRKNQEPAKESSLWYVVNLGGTPVGYAHEAVKRVEEKGVQGWVTSQRLLLTVKRLGTRVQMASLSRWEETLRGELRRVSLSLSLSNVVTTTEAEIGSSEITVSSGTGEKRFSQKIPYSGYLLGPMGLNLLTISMLRTPGDRVEFTTYSPELNLVVHGMREAEAWETVYLPTSPSPVKTLRVRESSRELPSKRTIWFNENGRLVQYQEASPLGEVKVTLSSEEEALAAASGEELTELPFERALVRANVRLPKARLIERMKIRLLMKKPELGFPELPTTCQEIIARERAALVLEIKRPSRKSARDRSEKQWSAHEAVDLKEYLEANPYLNTEDKLIKQVTAEVTRGLTDEWQKARRLRDWVSQNIVFDAGIVFAPSAEVIRQRRGTCVSFAVLLATLARAAGIPSRFIMGYAYVNGVWGGHAWVELNLDGIWYPFDAALPSPQVADASRIALVSTSLNQGLGEVMAAGEHLFGQLDIEILEYQVNGETFQAPGKIYEVKGNRYYNFGLKVEVEKPPSFFFEELDKTWPDNTLLVIKGEGVEVRFSEQAWRPVAKFEDYLRKLAGPAFSRAKVESFIFTGKKAYRLASPGETVVFILRDTDLWELRAKGKGAARLLAEVLRKTSFK